MKPDNFNFTGRKHTPESNRKRSESLKKFYATNKHMGFQTKYKTPEEKREAILHNRRKYRYGITKEEYKLMLHIQHGKCLICGNEAKVVDHDHTNNIIRGMLCPQCNSGLGFFRDAPELLIRAAAYLSYENPIIASLHKFEIIEVGLNE